ncbi:MAG: MFS transporter, partial [Promethearchaeota archaeon]
IRNALIISAALTPLLTFAQIIIFEPWYLFIIRILLGLVIGLVWPNCFNLLSTWQKTSTPNQTKKFFNYFNFSWNLGFIGGLITGYFWAFFWSDYLAMIISFFMSFLLIPFSFFLQKVPEGGFAEKISIDQVVEKLPPVKGDSDPKIETMMLAFPILFSWIGLVILSIAKSIVIFSYPVFIKSFDENLSDLTYLVQAGIQFGQVIGLTLINSMNPPKRKYSALFSILALTAIATSFLVFRNILMITILSIFSGLFYGLLHGVSMKIMLDYGTAKNTTKYSTINEIIIGIGFGVTPIIAGYVAEVDIYLMFTFNVFLGICLFLFLFFRSRNIKWKKPKLN